MKTAKNYRRLVFSFLCLKLILVLAFMRKRLLGFYIFFELSLIPTLIIILGWGIQPERIRAGSYLMIYTLVGSLPLLGTILYVDFHCGSIKIFRYLVRIFFFSKKDYRAFCFLWILAFLIKLPIYGVHLWLPKAHVEAPVAGSMVLAGILLKLGAYGLIRSLNFIYINMCFWSEFFFYVINYKYVFSRVNVFSAMWLKVTSGLFLCRTHVFNFSCLFFIWYYWFKWCARNLNFSWFVFLRIILWGSVFIWE